MPARLRRRRGSAQRSPFAGTCRGAPRRTCPPWSSSPDHRRGPRSGDRGSPRRPELGPRCLAWPSCPYSVREFWLVGVGGIELTLSLGQLIGRRHGAVPGVRALRQRQPFALEGLRDDDGRPASRVAGAGEGIRVPDLVEVVTVDLEDSPAEGRENGADIYPGPRISPVAPVGRSAALVGWDIELLHPVPVEDRREVGQPVARGDLDGFPDHTFLDLPVAEHHEGVEVLAGHLSAERDTGAEGQALPERTGAGVETG